MKTDVCACHVLCMCTTKIRVSASTRDTLSSLADRFGWAVSAMVDRAVRLLEQETMGNDLAAALREDGMKWLGADDE